MRLVKAGWIASLSLLLVLSACGKPDSSSRSIPGWTASARAGTRSDLQELEAELQASSPHSIPPVSWLSKIDRSLAPGQALQSIEVGGDLYDELAPIPPWALRKIVSVTYSNSHHSGLAVLQASFWTQVAALQARGIRIAFVVSAPNERSFYGRAFYHPEFIGLSLLADEGTLAHELRHLRQYRYLSRYSQQTPAHLSRNCLKNADQFFRELDATTVQLKYWVGVRSTPLNERLMRFDLDYPARLAGKVIGSSSCPESLVRAAERIQFLLILQKEKIEKTLHSAPQEADSVIRRSARSRPVVIRRILERLNESTTQDLCRFAGGFAFMTDCD